MYAREQTEILAYGQEILEQLFHEKQTKSLLEYLNNDQPREDLGIHKELEKLYYEFCGSFWKRDERGEVSEEDYIKYVDWAVLVWRFGYIGQHNLGETMEMMLHELGKRHKERYPMLNDYLDEIKKHVSNPHFRKFFRGFGVVR